MHASYEDAAACHKNGGGWAEVVDEHTNVAQLNKHPVELALVLTSPR